MKVTCIKNIAFKKQEKVLHHLHGYCNVSNNLTNNNISFKGRLGPAKYFWKHFRNLSDYMKEASEMTNSIIAMIGTGIIAPFAIMCSPKKKCPNSKHVNVENEHKIDREKKFFQAIRQPVSAVLAFAFQVPTTIWIAKGLNMLAYKKHAKLFNDEVLGHLIPDKKYMKGEAKNILNKKASPKLLEEWKPELEILKDTDALKAELKDKIKQDYQEIGIKLDDKTLDKMAGNKRKMQRFLSEKMVDAKQDRLLNEKVQELATKHFDIKDVDLVTEDYKNLAELRYKEDINTLRKNAKLNWFDKFIQSMGLSNKKLNKLSKAETALKEEKGLELMKKDLPEVFSDGMAKLRKFVENKNIKSQKLYANKIFWLTLGTNMVMVGISCVALNWLHPKLAHVIDKIRGKKPDEPQTEHKVEVKV